MKPISYKEFLKRLRKTPRTWILTRDWPRRQIRDSTDDAVCPALQVEGFIDHHNPITKAVFDAADNVRGHDPKIRADLLKACGIVRTDA